MVQEIRDREALCLLLRDFLNPALDSDPDPLGDLRAFHDECVLAGLAVVERRLDRARKERADVREIDAFETMTRTVPPRNSTPPWPTKSRQWGARQWFYRPVWRRKSPA